MALGIFFSFRIVKFPDLRCDGTYPLGAAVASVLILNGVSPFIATFLALITGCLAGVLTGVLNTKFNIPAIVASILVMTGLYSINLIIMQKPILSLKKEDTLFATIYTLQSNNFFHIAGYDLNQTAIPLFLLIFVLIIKLTMDWILYSNLGVALRISGSNNRMATSLAINTNISVWIGLAIGNGLIALSGALFAQIQRFCDVNLGFGMVVVGLASVFIAEGIETQLFKQSSIALATTLVIVGSLIYKLAVAIAYEMGLKTDYFNLLTSLIVFLSLLIPSIRKEIRNMVGK
jgi:putative ABC transport system permease protein